MALNNSELRAYARSSQMEPPKSAGSSPIIFVALAAMIGLGGAYAYQTGFFYRVQPVARLKAVLPSVVTSTPPAPAPASARP